MPLDKLYIFGGIILVLIAIFAIVLKRVFDLDKDAKREASQALGPDRDERLLRLYQSIEDMMDGFEEYVSETRMDIEEQKSACQQQTAACTHMLSKVEETVKKMVSLKQSIDAKHSAIEAMQKSRPTISVSTPDDNGDAAPVAPPQPAPAFNSAPPASTVLNGAPAAAQTFNSAPAVAPAFNSAPPGPAASSEPIPANVFMTPSPAAAIYSKPIAPGPVRVSPLVNNGANGQSGEDFAAVRPQVVSGPAALPVSPAAPKAASRPAATAVVRPKGGGTKQQKVMQLINSGLSPDDAARELGIGKGEVQLIMGLMGSIKK